MFIRGCLLGISCIAAVCVWLMRLTPQPPEPLYPIALDQKSNDRQIHEQAQVLLNTLEKKYAWTPIPNEKPSINS